MNMGIQEVQYWIFEQDLFSEHLDRQMYREKNCRIPHLLGDRQKKSWDNRVFVASSDNAEKKVGRGIYNTNSLPLPLAPPFFIRMKEFSRNLANQETKLANSNSPNRATRIFLTSSFILPLSVLMKELVLKTSLQP